jgi:putative molybdopterin biosynthesis protein
VLILILAEDLMSIYLKDIPLAQAQSRLAGALEQANQAGILGRETIPLSVDALGRVLAEPLWAKISSPHYHAAAMDGFAVRSKDTEGAAPAHPVSLRAGDLAVYIDTGDPLPGWANAVIPIENVEPLAQDDSPAENPRHPQAIRIRSAVVPWNNVRAMGEDMVATQLVLPAGHVLRPVDLGAIAASGHDVVTVARRPKVAILPTGTELVPIGQPVKAGDIIEFNSLVLAAQVETWGGQAARFPMLPDNLDAITKQVREAAETHDLILLNAGSSAGSEDFSAEVVQSLGEVLVHGVAIRPGHPVILGMIHLESGRTAVIFGVPGYPVSSALTGEIFVEPLLARWTGRRPHEPVTIPATITRKVVSPLGDDDYLRVVVGKVGDRTLVAPLSRGAGVITSLVRADGIVVLPRGSQGVPAGEKVNVRLYRQPSEIEETIFAIGSHDITLDLLAQFVSAKGRRLASANVGSLGGLVALRRGEAHLAGSHLLDPETGEFNLASIRQYLPETPVVLVTLVGREQGLIVQAGNPKKINDLGDLARPDIMFVNRQRGAGTRVLLDYQLDLMGIAPAQIRGYNQEDYTHLAVAAAVASGRADCGMGIAAAASALDLVFLPLFQERYDLVIPTVHYHSPLLAPLLDVLRDRQFQAAVAALPGYDIRQMGQVVAEIQA